jgi:hypothetical protein
MLIYMDEGEWQTPPAHYRSLPPQLRGIEGELAGNIVFPPKKISVIMIIKQ